MGENIQSLSGIDYAILVGYFALIVLAGVLLSKKASQGIANYFLGGRTIPWWAIGMSGTASNFDMTGTMVIISFFYAIGLQGFWVSMRGGMGLPLGILMVYMGKWLRRSNVMTTAEWMKTRFGTGRQGQTARVLSAVSNMIVTMAFLVYFVKGTGKFLAIFLPFSPEVCSLLMIAIAITYTACSGFYGVIYTDVIQEVIVLSVSIFVGYKAFTLPDHAEVLAFAGDAWSAWAPQTIAAPMQWLASPDLYRLFSLCIVFWVARGVFEGLGGFTGGYMSQRYYAARNDREAGLLTAEWIFLILFRWSLIMGCVLLGLSIAHQSPEIAALLSKDPEKTLPVVLVHAIPAGIRGLMIAGLIAAAMSTFDSTINAGVSYWVRDIYQPYLHPKANRKQLMRQSYIATFVFAAIAVSLGLAVKNINEIWSWITGPLSAGLFAPVILRWYWWRFNGYGFAISTAVGLSTSLLLKAAYPELAFYLSFLYTWGASLTAGIVGSLLTEQTPIEVLKDFWLRVRPFGGWGAVRATLAPDRVQLARQENTVDILNVFYAVSWHLVGVVAVLSLLLHQWGVFTLSLSIYLSLSILLYFTWYKHLQSSAEGDIEAAEALSTD